MSDREHSDYRSDGRARVGRRLYRDGDNGVFFGVCAGLSDFFGFDRTLIRVITAIGALLFFPTVLVVYFVLALLVPKKPAEARGERSEYLRSLQRRVRSSPHATLENVRHRFRELDDRLQRLEKYLTSSRFKLDREFESLKD